MDISNLDLNHIELFSIAYVAAKNVFNVEPVNATARKQRKIRKWVMKTYFRGIPLPKNVLNFVDTPQFDSAFIAFMAACAKQIDEHSAWKKQLLEKAIADFSEDVRKAFLDLFGEMAYCGVVEKQEGKIIFHLDNDLSCKRKLILHTSKENSLGEFDALDFGDAQILKENDGYKLIFVVEKYVDEMSIPTAIFFDRATTEIDICRADCRTFGSSPWETLSRVALSILDKGHLGDRYLNQKEQALLPLLKELQALSPWSPFSEGKIDFEILKRYIRKHNLPHLIPLLDKYAARENTGKPFNPFLFSRLNNKLNAADCEDLWRELYALVADTQEGYADETASCGQRKLNKIRRQIEECFHSLGYEGSYPTFRKYGAMKGIHLAESYNQSYFVGPEKNTAYIVQCEEFLNFNTLSVQFMCGTAFLKKGETVTDIYSCCFNKNGRRLFKSFSWDTGDMDTLPQFVTIAAKKAECTKLGKEETALLGIGKYSWQYFVTLFIFAGGLFATLMTAATFAILCLVTAIMDGISGIPEMLRQMPWWFFFVFSFLAFGLTMAIVDIKSKMK